MPVGQVSWLEAVRTRLPRDHSPVAFRADVPCYRTSHSGGAAPDLHRLPFDPPALNCAQIFVTNGWLVNFPYDQGRVKAVSPAEPPFWDPDQLAT